jgi:hypothetical protein
VHLPVLAVDQHHEAIVLREHAVLIPALHVAFEMARVAGLRRFDVTGATVSENR